VGDGGGAKKLDLAARAARDLQKNSEVGARSRLDDPILRRIFIERVLLRNGYRWSDIREMTIGEVMERYMVLSNLG
jgi:hypothetical protein